jgi:hypothetical protein
MVFSECDTASFAKIADPFKPILSYNNQIVKKSKFCYIY